MNLSLSKLWNCQKKNCRFWWCISKQTPIKIFSERGKQYISKQLAVGQFYFDYNTSYATTVEWKEHWRDRPKFTHFFVIKTLGIQLNYIFVFIWTFSVLLNAQLYASKWSLILKTHSNPHKFIIATRLKVDAFHCHTLVPDFCFWFVCFFFRGFSSDAVSLLFLLGHIFSFCFCRQFLTCFVLCVWFDWMLCFYCRYYFQNC